MKRALIAVLMASLLASAHSTFAQSPSVSERNLIYTEGIAEVKGQNDSARISIAVVTCGRILEQAGSKNADKTKAVITAIKGLNIKDLKLKTSGYRVTPRRDHKNRSPKIKGYEVRNAIEVTLEEFEPEHLSEYISKIVGRALESGANDINGIQIYIKDKEPLEKEALTQATQEAMGRARILALAAGVKLKRIVSLSTNPIHVPSRQYMLRAGEIKAEAGAVSPPIEIGESKVRVQVNVAYEIE
jgi:uncharacterized protein YggE